LTQDLGPGLRYKQSPALQMLAHSPLKHFADNPVLSGLGKAGGALSVGVAGIDLVESVGHGDLAGAGDSGIDMAASGLKATGNPVAYGIGVNLMIWKDVGKAATDVDWSHMGDITHASAGDWRDAFGESLMQIPGKAWKWF
jgi:hypothetical protein